MNTTDTSLPELSRNPLMQAMRRVIQAAAKSRLAPESLSRMSPDLAAIGRIMDLTPAQSLLFTLFVEMSYAQEINLRDLCEYVECQHIDLAERCDLSGGQIENVARRYTVEHILHGTPLTLEGILELCRAERIDERPLTASQHPIGFRGAGVKQ